LAWSPAHNGKRCRALACGGLTVSPILVTDSQMADVARNSILASGAPPALRASSISGIDVWIFADRDA
jgi:hypothetical protein